MVQNKTILIYHRPHKTRLYNAVRDWTRISSDTFFVLKYDI